MPVDEASFRLLKVAQVCYIGRNEDFILLVVRDFTDVLTKLMEADGYSFSGCIHCQQGNEVLFSKKEVSPQCKENP